MFFPVEQISTERDGLFSCRKNVKWDGTVRVVQIELGTVRVPLARSVEGPRSFSFFSVLKSHLPSSSAIGTHVHAGHVPLLLGIFDSHVYWLGGRGTCCGPKMRQSYTFVRTLSLSHNIL